MHATTQQLISIRDRELVTVEAQQHLETCDQCQQALKQLQAVRNTLQQWNDNDLTATDASEAIDFAARWEQVKKHAVKRQYHRRQRLLQWSIAACVAAIAIIAVPIYFYGGYQTNNLPTNQLATDSSIESQPNTSGVASDNRRVQEQLLARNAQLENALRDLPQPPKVMRASTAYTIASFEDQIAMMDYELSYGAEIGMDDARSVSLLQNRADLLGTLYKLRYSQAMASLASY